MRTRIALCMVALVLTLLGDLVVYGLSVRMDAPSGVGIGAFLFFRRPYRRESVPYEKG